MIKNEKEYKITKSWLRKFENGKTKLSKLPESKEQPWLRRAQHGSLQAQIDQFKEEIKEYESLKSGKVKLPSLDSLSSIPELLIKNHIVNGWTLEQMAKRLGLHYQQIQRYENTEYATATFTTLKKVADVLSKGSASKKKRKHEKLPHTKYHAAEWHPSLLFFV